MELAFKQVARQLAVDVDELTEEMKFMEYSVGDHFSTWHVDTGRDARGRSRKLSMSVELGAKHAYTGGQLEIFPEPTTAISVQRGGAVIFPSFRYHRVTEVTSGTRFSLVNWISGPAYR